MARFILATETNTTSLDATYSSLSHMVLHVILGYYWYNVYSFVLFLFCFCFFFVSPIIARVVSPLFAWPAEHVECSPFYFIWSFRREFFANGTIQFLCGLHEV